jgi:ankyrin repeat protein
MQPGLRTFGITRMEVVMKNLPPRPHLGHLRNQAKTLLKACRDRDDAALARIRTSLPAASKLDHEAIIAMNLRLHDAQSCIAREYGFPSWAQLKDYVEAQAAVDDEQALLDRWKFWTFGAGYQPSKPSLAARLLREHPALLDDRPALACAVGNVATVGTKLASDPAWARIRGTPQARSPLQCACFSGLIRLPEFAPGIRQCVQLLLDAGADPNDRFIDPALPDEPLSVLFAAAGVHHDVELTRMLLDAGADPNDGESLYHAAEASDSECVRLLLEAGARVQGCNALPRSLDFERPLTTRLLLEHGGDISDSQPIGFPLLHAIRRRRSAEVVRILLEAGADPAVRNSQGVSAFHLAQRMGLSEVAELLRTTDTTIEEDPMEAFLAACARADRATVQHMLESHPGMIGSLGHVELHLLPDLAAEGCDEAVRVMVEAGWPVSVRGGDIKGSALNYAVFRGDSKLAAFLLAHGARYDERHAYNDNVIGTLSFASRAETVPLGDWLGCAEALIASGAPIPDAKTYVFAEDVAAYFEELRSARDEG